MTRRTTIRAAILGSSGGSALMAATECARTAGFDPQLLVITDRECGLSRWSEAQEFETVRIPFESKQQLSGQVLRALRERGHDNLLLYYTRLVGAPLIDGCCVCNIHPSLLPAFPGMHAVEQALAGGARALGATLHRVDAGLDTGPIMAQVACPLAPATTVERANRLSYMQKVWLNLVWFEQLATVAMETSAVSAPSFATANLRSDAAIAGAAVHLASPDLACAPLRTAWCEWASALETDGDAALAHGQHTHEPSHVAAA